MPCLIHEHGDIFARFADGGNRTGTGVISGHPEPEPEPEAGWEEGGGGDMCQARFMRAAQLINKPAERKSAALLCCLAALLPPACPRCENSTQFGLKQLNTRLQEQVQNKEPKTRFQAFLCCTCGIRTVFIPK